MKKNSVFNMLKKTGWAAALAASTMLTYAQISIGPTGAGPLTFETLPTVAEGWATYPDDGSDAGNVTTVAAMDANMQTNIAANISTVLGSSGTVNPPSQNALARWNSANRYIQTRSTSVLNTKLMATLRNDSGGAVSRLTIEYTAGTEVASGSTIVEQIWGHQVYYSTTGEANSWVKIPDLSNVLISTVNETRQLVANIDLGAWPAGGMLYILWLDDNGSDDNSGTTQEGVYTIDNVQFSIASAEGPVAIINPALPSNLSLDEYDRATFNFQVSGSTPTYRWYKNNQLITGATSATYVITNVTPNDAGTFYVVAQNTINSATSRVALLTVEADILKPAVASVVGIGASTVRVVFNEAVTPATMTNIANYTLSGPTTINVASATRTGTNTVELQLSAPRQFAVEYTLTVRNVQDLAQTPNTMLPQSLIITPEYNLPVFAINHVWKYNTNGVDLGTAWKETVYDDSAWPEGPGILGYETSGAATTAFAAQGESMRTSFGQIYSGTPTYYFRTTFENTNLMGGLGLVAEGFFDDGAIFWLNGVEVGRFANPGTWPADPITFASLVSDDTNPEGTLWTVVLNGAPMRFGQNVLAVEMHQNSLTSSDIVMGFRLNQVIPAPLAITSQPVGTNIMEGQNMNLTVGYSGSLAAFQWYLNGQPVPGANAATYNPSPSTTNMTGAYYVVLTNGISAVTSATVNVTVRLDDIKPFVYYAVMQTNGYNLNYGDICLVQVQFSEPVVAAEATNRNNYFIVREGDATNAANHLTIYDAVLANGTNLTLTCAAKQETPVVNYRLFMGNINDLAANPNTMAFSTNYMYLRFFVIKSISQQWRYNASGADLGTTWTSSTFNDTAWNLSFSPFGDQTYEAQVPGAGGWGSLSDYIPVSNTITSYYYRTTFNLPSDPMGVRLNFEIWADDGAVFYVNGTEARNDDNNAANPNGRYYMTNGTEVIRATTQAQNHTAGTPSQRDMLYPLNLRNGANTLAVSVHQNLASTPLDHAFALQVIATIPPLSRPIRPALISQPQNITTNLGSTVTFTANGEGTLPMTARWYFKGSNLLQTTSLPSGTAITNIPTLLALTRSNIQGTNEGTYSLVLSNASGMVTSRVATLTVLRAPVFLSQPVNQSVAVGGTATFAASVDGSVPLRYQWYYNDVNPLFNQTNATLTILNVQSEQAGSYKLVAYNTVATNSSTVVTLTVSGGEPTRPLIPPGGAVYAGPGGNVSLQVQTEVGRTYTLQYNLNVENAAGWTDVLPAVTGNGSIRTLSEVNPTSVRRFYRIKVQ